MIDNHLKNGNECQFYQLETLDTVILGKLLLVLRWLLSFFGINSIALLAFVKIRW